MSGAAGSIPVTVVAPVGRLDVSLPAGVSVAEVSAELVARLGLGAGLALHTVLGMPLAGGASIGAQVQHGAVLHLTEATGRSDLVVHDDVGEAVASVQRRRDVIDRATEWIQCAPALVIGVLVAQFAAPGTWSPDPLFDSVLVSMLLVVGVAIILAPRLAVTLAGLSQRPDSSRVAAAVKRGRALLGGFIVGLGGLLVVLVPLGLAAGLAQGVLALDVLLGLMLLARSLCRTALGQEAPDGLPFGTANRGRWRLTWVADGLEWLTRFLLVPFAVWAFDLIRWAHAWSPG